MLSGISTGADDRRDEVLVGPIISQRLENDDVKRQLEAKRSTAAGTIQFRLTSAALRHLSISTPSMG